MKRKHDPNQLRSHVQSCFFAKPDISNITQSTAFNIQSTNTNQHLPRELDLNKQRKSAKLQIVNSIRISQFFAKNIVLYFFVFCYFELLTYNPKVNKIIFFLEKLLYFFFGSPSQANCKQRHFNIQQGSTRHTHKHKTHQRKDTRALCRLFCMSLFLGLLSLVLTNLEGKVLQDVVCRSAKNKITVKKREKQRGEEGSCQKQQ